MKWLLCMVWLTMFGSAQAEQFVTKVIAVLDGDTVLIHRANGVLKVRLADIDAPEVEHAEMGGQPFGVASQQSLSRLVLGKQVKFVSQAMDKYGRMVAHLSINGADVNTEQIRLGMAWEYSHYHRNQELIALQAEAQAASRGLWATSSPTPPWEWRKQHISTLPAQNSAPRDVSCGAKKHCSEMTSCDEARHYLTVCGLKYLDGDGDGNPCEKLCAPRAKKHKDSTMH